MSQQEQEQPQPSSQKSKLDLLEESLSSIIDDISFSSHSAAVIEPISKLPSQSALNPAIKVEATNQHSTLNLETPIQSEFADEYSNFHIPKLTPQVSISNTTQPFEQLLNNFGYSSYVHDFHSTGVSSLADLIRFATQYLPPSLNVTPAPLHITATDTSTPAIFPYPSAQSKDTTNKQQIKFNQSRHSYEMHEEKEEKKEEKQIKNSNTKKKKHKLRLYEVEELLGDEEYCEYALLIRDGGNNSINGYYTCSGKKNDHYMFNHMNDNKAALYCAKNGTWMVVYDDELLYGNPLKYDSVGGRDILLLSELNLYPPPPRCWYAIEGINPPPGVMWIEITDNPMAFIDMDMAHRLQQETQNEIYMNKLKVDLPVQMIDFMFCGPIGFALRIDDDSKVMDVIRMTADGQAAALGLKYGDTLLKINEEDISTAPSTAFPMLKECVQSEVAFEVTFLRKKYDELVINVCRAGSPQCNGKYIFLSLDEFDAPIFVKDNDMETWRILRLDHDESDGQSIWAIQNIREMNEYYIGISESYSPPNNTWETIEDNGKNPAPGLQFIAVDDNVMQKLVPDGPKIRQNIFTGTKRKRNQKMNHMYDADDDNNVVDEDYQFGQNEHTNNDVIVSLNSFKMEILGQTNEKTNEANESESLARKVSFNPSNLAKHAAMISGGNNIAYNFNRSDSIMSTKSIYAIPDEVTNALSEYQKHILDLEKELKQERKRALTLSHKHKTQQSILQEHKELMNDQKESLTEKIQFFRDELYTVNNAYYQLWIKQSDTKLDFTKISKESHKTMAKFGQTKKQLFQAKRKIDDLNEEMEELQNELDHEKLLNSKNNKSKEDELFLYSTDNITNNLELIELQTDIASLKAEIASKCIEIDELEMDNEKWQEANDSIFERMTEAQIRLAKEIEEFEDAKKFYENKLSILRDRIQDNSIHFWEYEKRIQEISKMYENETGKVLSEWKNKPNIKYDTNELNDKKRVSITFGSVQNSNKSSRNSMSIGWGALSPAASNNYYKQHDTLYDEDENSHDDSSDKHNHNNNTAFGFTATIYDEESSDHDNDNVNAAFGTFDDDDDDDDDATNAFGIIH